jgi:selenocysteine-specific elongation factor
LAGAFAPALLDQVERTLAEAGEIVTAPGRVALATHDPLVALNPAQRSELDQIETLLREGGAAPPDPDELRAHGGELLDLLLELSRAVALRNYALRKTVVFHVDALATARDALAAAFPPPARFTTGEARQALGTSRKFIVPLLEGFDARGWTCREGDVRQIAGPPSQ